MKAWKALATLLLITLALTASGCFYWHGHGYDRGGHEGQYYEHNDRHHGDHHWNYEDKTYIDHYDSMH